MAKNSGKKGRYICKVGFYDVYAKDSINKVSGGKVLTEYFVFHSKKMLEKGLKTKELAIKKSLDLLGEKYRLIYNL